MSRFSTAYLLQGCAMSALLIGALAFLIYRATRARTRGGQAVCLALALLILFSVLVLAPALDWLMRVAL